jgi:hypothetical protein
MSQSDITAYMAQLNPQEQRVLKIALEHLESSFNLGKSIGFIEWQAQKNKQCTNGVGANGVGTIGVGTNAVGTGTITLQPLQSKL